MVQIIENWSEVKGTIVIISPSIIDGFSKIRLSLDEINSVYGFTNLLKDYKEREIDLLVQSEVVKTRDIKVGDILRCRVRYTRQERIFINDEYLQKLQSLDTKKHMK